MLYLFIFSELSGPSGARMRTNTEVRSALPSPKPSLPRGLLRGEPPNVPKKSPMFFQNISVSTLSFSYPWKKRTRGISNHGTGPAESRGRLRLRDTAPPHHPTPTLLMNAKFLADVYLSRIQEHGNKVRKQRLETHKASMGHTVDSTKTNLLYS